MSTYAAAALVTWAAGTVVCAAFWIGRGKLINEWRDYCAESAKQNMPRYQQFDVEPRYVEAGIASLEKQFEVPVVSAEKLRQAATLLRKRANAATAPESMHPWGDKDLPSLPPERHPSELRGYLGGTWGEYYATLHPGVGYLIADWLDDAAMWMSIPRSVNHDGKAVEIADLILGGDPS